MISGKGINTSMIMAGLALLGALWAASQIPAAAAELPRPHQVVQQATAQVVDFIQANRQGAADQGDNVAQLLDILEPVVAFEPIARAVIGAHADALDDQQTREFTRTFKTTMTRLYLDSMMAFDIKEVDVIPPETAPQADADRASVEVDVVAQDDQRYRLSYFLGLDDGGNWKVRNIIVDGINLGRTYRSQFDSAMATYDNDPERVIAQWNQLVDGQ